MKWETEGKFLYWSVHGLSQAGCLIGSIRGGKRHFMHDLLNVCSNYINYQLNWTLYLLWKYKTRVFLFCFLMPWKWCKGNKHWYNCVNLGDGNHSTKSERSHSKNAHFCCAWPTGQTDSHLLSQFVLSHKINPSSERLSSAAVHLSASVATDQDENPFPLCCSRGMTFQEAIPFSRSILSGSVKQMSKCMVEQWDLCIQHSWVPLFHYTFWYLLYTIRGNWWYTWYPSLEVTCHLLI